MKDANETTSDEVLAAVVKMLQERLYASAEQEQTSDLSRRSAVQYLFRMCCHRNAAGKFYAGIVNQWLCTRAAFRALRHRTLEWGDTQWLTASAAEKKGWSMRQGVNFGVPLLSPVGGRAGRHSTTVDHTAYVELRQIHTVFPLGQFDGPVREPLRLADLAERISDLYRRLGVAPELHPSRKDHERSSHGYFCSARDTVWLEPFPRASSRLQATWCLTALHELMHWARAAPRLSHKLDTSDAIGQSKDPNFSSDQLEELIAEMGSIVLSARLGFDPDEDLMEEAANYSFGYTGAKKGTRLSEVDLRAALVQIHDTVAWIDTMAPEPFSPRWRPRPQQATLKAQRTMDALATLDAQGSWVNPFDLQLSQGDWPAQLDLVVPQFVYSLAEACFEAPPHKSKDSNARLREWARLYNPTRKNGQEGASRLLPAHSVGVEPPVREDDSTEIVDLSLVPWLTLSSLASRANEPDDVALDDGRVSVGVRPPTRRQVALWQRLRFLKRSSARGEGTDSGLPFPARLPVLQRFPDIPRGGQKPVLGAPDPHDRALAACLPLTPWTVRSALRAMEELDDHLSWDEARPVHLFRMLQGAVREELWRAQHDAKDVADRRMQLVTVGHILDEWVDLDGPIAEWVQEGADAVDARERRLLVLNMWASRRTPAAGYSVPGVRVSGLLRDRLADGRPDLGQYGKQYLRVGKVQLRSGEDVMGFRFKEASDGSKRDAVWGDVFWSAPKGSGPG